MVTVGNKSPAVTQAWPRSVCVLSATGHGVKRGKRTEQSNIQHSARVSCLQEAETGKHRKWDDLINREEAAAGKVGGEVS